MNIEFLAWRCFLPESALQRVLVLSDDPGLLAVLAEYAGSTTACNADQAGTSRSMQRVEFTQAVPKGRFSLLIMDAQSRSAQIPAGEWLEQLQCETRVLLGGGGDRLAVDTYLRGHKPGRLLQLAAIPPAQPRVLFPRADPVLQARALDLHVPARRRLSLALALLRPAQRFGWRGWLPAAAVQIAGLDGTASGPPLLDYLRQVLGQRLRGLVSYASPASTTGRCTLLAVTAQGQADYIVKLAAGAAARQALRQEAQALHDLERDGLGDSVPGLIHDACEWAELSFIIQSQVGRDVHRQHLALAQVHLDFLIRLSQLQPRQIPLRGSALAQPLLSSACCPTGAKEFADLKRHASHCAQQGASIRVHRWHGDFVPWNLRIKGQSLWAFDWENSRADGLALGDLWHFLLRRNLCVGPWQGAQQEYRLYRQQAEILRARLPGGETLDLSMQFTIWLLWEMHWRPNPRLQELAAVHLAELAPCDV